MYFEDRVDAGRRLARLLLARGYTGEDTIVLGLPRGGVTVASEVADALGAPLDVWVVRKVGTPHDEELGLGAVAEGGIAFLDRKMLARMGVPEAVARRLVKRKAMEVKERVARFRGGAAPPELWGRTVIVVDDGIATGGTMRASLQSLRERRPGLIVLAVPVAGEEILEELRPLVEDLVCVLPTSDLEAVGQWYASFPQVPDEDVVALLARARARAQGGGLPLGHGA
ncbi:phosphoribosyltransferase [Corallococcus llansteffanensis]|uniref:Phosphoribosyltransferase n=1 Tax=Corallococcus llansteffanensis TaxID=2316731 RepID=A0A3A8P0I2_9BACT|nr:phosphoribosyltransferase family protein [Corallococcus llansteffanensis]RKH49299.1 phosphoribosyltransferase [Corallococcus llansteffanensis]